MIYVHVPFCKSFCSYCAFYSERLSCDASRSLSEMEAYAEAVCAEALSRQDEIAKTLEVNTLYFGGGTPSVLPSDILGRIAGLLSSLAGRPFTEFTVEVNPDDIVSGGPAYVEALLKLGVNRFSMGVQSLDDAVLPGMGRRHDASEALKAVRILRQAGAVNLSLDLIFGWPHLSADSWRRSIEGLLELPGGPPQHLSAYQLSIDEGSALWERSEREEALDLPAEEVCAAQYDLLCSLLAGAGYRHYEISNFALRGFEAVHNSAY